MSVRNSIGLLRRQTVARTRDAGAKSTIRQMVMIGYSRLAVNFHRFGIDGSMIVEHKARYRKDFRVIEDAGANSKS